MRELFIYFKARPEHEAELRTRLHAMQLALRETYPDLKTRLLLRPDPRDGLHTWMETYSGFDGLGFDSQVDRAITQAAQSLEPLIMGARKTEVFVVCEDA